MREIYIVSGSGLFFDLIRVTGVHFIIIEFYINFDSLFFVYVSQFKKKLNVLMHFQSGKNKCLSKLETIIKNGVKENFSN